MCFIFDKLANTQKMVEYVNMKRAYTIEEEPEQLVGGITILDRPTKLPADERKALKNKIGELQKEFGIQKAAPKKWPELTGAHRRLYADAVNREERMASLKKEIDSMIEE